MGAFRKIIPRTLEKLEIPGFRIPMLFREPDGRYSDPKNYPRLSLAQPATHDHPPLAAMWAECWANIETGINVESNQRELKHMIEFAGMPNEEAPREFNDHLHEAYTRAVMNSPSWLWFFSFKMCLPKRNVSTPPARWRRQTGHTDSPQR